MIPSELTNIPRWINWEQRGNDKKPLSPTGRVANALHYENWQTYEQAKANSTKLGFVLDGDYVVIDGDHEPYISLLTNQYIEKTYCEVSPRGGIHVWLKGSHVNKRGKFEVYSDKRWITISSHDNNREIRELSNEDKEWILTHIK